MNELINFFKILSDETRLRIVSLLAVEDLCVCEICGALELSQPKVSKHLSKMRDKGFVDTEKKEQYVFYKLKLEDQTIVKIIQEIDKNAKNYPLLQSDRGKLDDKDKYLKECNLNYISQLK